MEEFLKAIFIQPFSELTAAQSFVYLIGQVFAAFLLCLIVVAVVSFAGYFLTLCTQALRIYIHGDRRKKK